MCIKTIVTFTGVDTRTDLGRLQLLQDRYPLAEFGILISASRQGKENRYPEKEFLKELCYLSHGNLALHVCGSLARNALQTDFKEIVEAIGGWPITSFDRIQLNGLSEINGFQPVRALAPGLVEEIIIQQNPSRPLLTGNEILVCNAKVSYLYDGSGGLGKETPFRPLVVKRHNEHETRVGYAGGINPDNVIEKWHEAMQATMHNDLWIDMESGIRTDDWFDLDKVEAVLKKMFPLN